VKKNLYYSEFFYLNSNKKLLMWYKKVKKMRMFWRWLVVKNIKKWKKKEVYEQYLMYCSMTNKPKDSRFSFCSHFSFFVIFLVFSFAFVNYDFHGVTDNNGREILFYFIVYIYIYINTWKKKLHQTKTKK
jgi:predicted nucleotidyltransferase